MALVKCVECEKEISDKALSCPHCGYSAKIAGITQIGSKFKETSKTVIKVSGETTDKAITKGIPFVKEIAKLSKEKITARSSKVVENTETEQNIDTNNIKRKDTKYIKIAVIALIFIVSMTKIYNKDYTETKNQLEVVLETYEQYLVFHREANTSLWGEDIKRANINREFAMEKFDEALEIFREKYKNLGIGKKEKLLVQINDIKYKEIIDWLTQEP